MAFKYFIANFIFSIIIGNVEGLDFYPFGNETSDLTLPRQDDAFTTIPLQFDLPFFGDIFREIHVSTNGIIYFGQGSTSFTPTPFPLNGTKCVAAYWVDSDPRMGGDIYYREIFDPEILKKISNNIRSKFVKYASFRSSWAFIVTFNNVPRFGCVGSTVFPCGNVVNHQTILTSNGIDSFVIFLYDKLGYANAQIGFNAGDGKRHFLVPYSNTPNISSYALRESNIGEAGKWMFSITSEISSACSSRGLLDVYPKKLLYFGGQQVLITGPCFEANETTINMSIGSITVNCSIVENLKIVCISPYIDRTGRIPLHLEYNNQTYSSFIVSHDESDDLVKSVEIDISRESVDANFRFTWNVNDALENETKIGGVQEDIYIDGNGNVIEIIRYQILLSVPNTGFYIFTPKPSNNQIPGRMFNMVRNIYVFIRSKITKITVVNSELTFSCDKWHAQQPNAEEMAKIKNKASRQNPCQPIVPWNMPIRLSGGFETDESCNPTKPVLCNFFHPGAKGCYRSTNNPGDIATQCCYNSNSQLLVGPPGGGTLDMSDSNKSKQNHFIKDVLPYFLCCKLTDKCDKYYEKRPSIDSQYYVPPRPVWANGDPHFVTLDGTEYDFNPVGEFIYLQTPRTIVQVRIVQFVDGVGIPKQASYFSAFAVKGSQSDVVQIELTAFKTIQVKAGKDILAAGTWEFDDINIDNSNNTHVSVDVMGGVKLEIYALNGILQVITMLEQNLKGRVYGLVGNWDDNVENDFMLPNGTFIPINSSNHDVHYEFGMHWSTTSATSIFSYPDGLSWKDFQNVNFVPLFAAPSSDPRCNGNKNCLFDLFVTGDVNVALSNIVIQEEVKKIETANQEFSETCLLNINIINGFVKSVYNGSDQRYVNYTISCHLGFQLTGSSTVQCVKGNYSHEFGNCIERMPSSDACINFVNVLALFIAFCFVNLENVF